MNTPFYRQHWQQIHLPVLTQHQAELWVCHLQCRVPVIAGNKWLKLKYHIQHIQQDEKRGILTFGGAFSNHLAAVAAAGKAFGFQTHAIVRHDGAVLNPTLAACQEQGMQLSFVSPQQYRQRQQPDYQAALQQQFPEWLLVPEGGTGPLGVQGVAELQLHNTPAGAADLICCATGSGGTVAGLALGHPQIPIWGITVVKDSSLPEQIAALVPHQRNWQLIADSSGQRYGQFDAGTLQLCLQLSQQDLPLEPVYTGKALQTLLVALNQGHIRAGQRLVFFHTGGLQGLDGLLHRERLTPEQYQQIKSAELRLWHQFG
ncbi:MAG: pyridoxal-phosphate dependent enzyme [Rheinheimera sp.]|nr:pyridoxal-phosphate dependent enzyme [Rheinheimera sp.]